MYKKGGRKVPRVLGKKVVTKYTTLPQRRAKIFRAPIGFPTSRLVRMRYVENYSLNPALPGLMAQYVFRCNSIFDPNETGTGGQPLGHDQWSVFYNKYVVVGSKITVVAQGGGSSGSGSVPVYTGIKRDLDGAIDADYRRLKEQGSMARVWQPLGDAKLKMNSYFSCKKHFGIANVKDGVDRYGALFGANPIDQMRFVHYYQAQDRASSVSPTVFTATIDYLVLCFEVKDLPAS